MLILVLVAVAAIFLAYAKLRKQRKKAGIRGWVVDQDLDGKGSTIYSDNKLGLSCKPDVVERNRFIEHKSSSVHRKARYGDILYVASQMLATGKKEAELRYANAKFSLSGNSALMQAAMHEVKSIMGQMRLHLLQGRAPKATPTRNKCAKCMFKAECSEAL